MYLECDNIVQQSWYQDNISLEINTHRIATIYLNRVDKRNALNAEMLNALNEAFDVLEEYHSENNINVRLLLLRANGKVFCAGADLKSMQQMVDYSYQDNYQDAVLLARVLERLADFPCPTISAINGNAYGGGIGLICATDFAIAVKSAEFCLSEVKLGLIPAVISPYLVSTMGYKTALRLTVAAKNISADEALKYNMLSDIADSHEDLEIILTGLISELMQFGPLAMQKAKRLIKEIYASSDDQNTLLGRTAELIASIRVSAEGQEGLQAFLNKKSPSWIID